MRISRALALSGINSRRKCEAYVTAGQVTVNGEVVRDLGRQVDPDNDAILFRGKPIQFENFVYYILHKPEGYTTTADDPHAEKTVFDLLPSRLVPKTDKPMPARTRVFPVGRLDKNSTGLLLFTNDGDLANQLIHPRYAVSKWYEVRLDRTLDPRDRLRLLKGIQLEDGMARAEKVRMLSKRNIQIMLREGKKREVRRLFDALQYEVLRLCRVAFGPILLGTLPSGRGRFLTSTEAETLRAAVKNPKKP